MHKIHLSEKEKLHILNSLIQQWRDYRKYVIEDRYMDVLIILAVLQRCIDEGKYKDGYNSDDENNVITDEQWLVKRERVMIEALDYVRRLREIVEPDNPDDKIFRFDSLELQVTFEVCNDAVVELEKIIGEEEVDNACGEAWGRTIDNRSLRIGFEIA